jgi:hypothetical protein
MINKFTQWIEIQTFANEISVLHCIKTVSMNMYMSQNSFFRQRRFLLLFITSDGIIKMQGVNMDSPNTATSIALGKIVLYFFKKNIDSILKC